MQGMKPRSSMAGNHRHCWECMSRSLVCDFTRPHCRRCTASGVPCPGYAGPKPRRLKWLATGQVKSRRPRRKPALDSPAMTVPPELQTDYHSIAEAVDYFNSCIYPSLVQTLQIAPWPVIYKLTPEMVQRGVQRPDYSRLGIICTAVSHRYNRARGSMSTQELGSLERKVLQYRGGVIRSLSRDILESQGQNAILAGIITLLLADAQQGFFTYRKWHLQGLWRLIEARGGIQTLKESEGMKPLLLCLAGIMVLGDTTVPGSHILLTASHIRDLHYIINQYGHADFAFGAFSTALFSALIQINHLRLRASRAGPTRTQTLTQEAFAVLQHIIDFSPETWASSKSCSRTDWLILGKVYRAAVVLYCICSLQSLGVLPESPSLMATRETHRQVLHALLSERMKHARFTLFVFWPTLVLGAEGGPQRRGFVHQQMDRVSFHMGTSMPLVAKAVLDDFWASGKTGWEDCFDREYGFLAALTVERSKV